MSVASRTFLGLGLVALLHGLVYLALLPPWMGEDEPWHYAKIEGTARTGEPFANARPFVPTDELQRDAALSHLQFKRAFPALELAEIDALEQEILESMRRTGFWRRVDWTGRDDTVESFDVVERGFTAAHQPPAYYLLCAPILLAASNAPIETRLLLLRSLSLLLFVGTVLLTYAAARMAHEDERLALLAALFVALWPMSARGGALVSNDVLARFFVAAAFYFGVRRLDRGDLVSLGGLLVSCVLALLTKTTGASAVGIAMLTLLLAPGSRMKLRASLLAAALVGLFAFAGTAAWVDSHNPAIPLGLQSAIDRFALGTSPANLKELGRSFVGSFNWESRSLPSWIPTTWIAVLLALTLLGSATTLSLFTRRSGILREPGEPARARIAWLTAGTLLIQFLLIFGRGVAKGRYLMPVLPALGILLALGLFLIVPKRARRAALLAFVAVLLVFDGFFLSQGLVPEEWFRWRW